MLQSLSAKPHSLVMTLDAVGGVWRYAMDLGVALGDTGVSVTFAGLGPRPSAAQRHEAEAIGELVWLDAPLDWMAERQSDLDCVPDLLGRVVEDARADLVHLNLPSQACDRSPGCPIVVASHSCVVSWFRAVRGTNVPTSWAWQETCNRRGFDRASAVVAPSASYAALLRTCYGQIDHLTVVPNAVRPIAKKAKEDVVFAAGRWWDEGKNGAVLDAAAPAIEWPVLMAGPATGPSGQFLPITSAKALGELPHREVRARMARAAIVVSPSLYEPFGLAALEAASAGAALVLADIPTYREIWDGAALFAAPGDPAAFADAANQLIHHSSLRHEMAKRANARAARFSPGAQANAMLGIYGSALAQQMNAPEVVGQP
jgi:glycosyltransferase involved in cell wall biosynthesis